MVNNGRFTSELTFEAGLADEDDDYPYSRHAEWLEPLQRSEFNQSAFYEVRSFLNNSELGPTASLWTKDVDAPPLWVIRVCPPCSIRTQPYP